MTSYVHMSQPQGDAALILRALSQPIVVSVDDVQVAACAPEDIVQATLPALARIEDLTNSGSDALALELVDQALALLEQLKGMTLKVAAIMLHHKGIIHYNLREPSQAAAALEKSIAVMTRIYDTNVGGNHSSQTQGDDASALPLDPRTPVSKLDIWCVKSDLLGVYCSLYAEGEQNRTIRKIADEIVAEIEAGSVWSPSIRRVYANALSSSVQSRLLANDEPNRTDLAQLVALQAKAFYMVKDYLPHTDPALVKHGLSYVQLLSLADRIFEASNILNDVALHLEERSVHKVHTLCIHAALCISLMYLIEEHPAGTSNVADGSPNNMGDLALAYASLTHGAQAQFSDLPRGTDALSMLPSLQTYTEILLDRAQDIADDLSKEQFSTERMILITKQRLSLAIFVEDEATIALYNKRLEQLTDPS